MISDEDDGRHDVLEHCLGDEVVEVHAHPAGLDALAAVGDLALELVGSVEVDAEQPVTVRSRARAAAARLDAEKVVEDGDDEVVVEVPAAGAVDDERHDRQPLGIEVAEHLDIRIRRPCCDGPPDEVLLMRPDDLGADRLFQLEHQTRADRLDDRRRAAFLAVHGIGDVVVLLGVDVGDGATADDVGDGVGQQLATHDEHAGRAGTPDELVRGQEHGVVVGKGVLVAAGAHVDVDVRSGRRVVPEREGAVLVQQLRNPVGVRDDAGHVAGGAERGNAQRAIAVFVQPCLEVCQIDMAVSVLVDGDDVGDRLAPRELIAVVLERADEHHGTIAGRDGVVESVAPVEVGGDAQVEDADQLVDGACRAGAGEDDAGVVVTVDGIADDPSRVLAQAGGLQSGTAGLRVGVGVARQDLVADEVLDEGQGATARCVVGVGDPPFAEGPLHDLVVADDAVADPREDGGLGQALVALRNDDVGHAARLGPAGVEG